MSNGFILVILFLFTFGARAQDVTEIELLSNIENTFASLKQVEFYLQESGPATSICMHIGVLAHAHNRLVQGWTDFATKNMSRALLNEEILETLPVNKKAIHTATLNCTEGFDLKIIQELMSSIRTRHDKFVSVLDQDYGIRRNRVVPASSVTIK